LALDGPRGLWKRRIKIRAADAVVVAGGQTILKIKESLLEEKTADEKESLNALRIPELLDEEFMRILDVTGKGDNEQHMATTETKAATDLANATSSEIEASITVSLPINTHANASTVFTYSNLSSATASCLPVSPSRQLTNILLRLDHILKQCKLLKSNINHCTLLLRSMSDFTVLNPVYAQYFDSINPPARVTIAAGSAMPADMDVMLSVTLDKTDARQGLHVQSRSYWAPANIGPYSQAISVPLPSEGGNSSEIVYIAGQIPLVPSTMEIYTEHAFRGQALLSLQHLWRIGRTKGVKNWTAGVGFIPASITNAFPCVHTAQDLWYRLHTLATAKDEGEDEDEDEDDDDDQDVDPWDRINSKDGMAFNDTTYRAPIPDYSAISSMSGHGAPPCFIAQVESLPRGVNIEWSATGLTSSSIHIDGNVVSPADSSSRFFSIEIKEKLDYKRLAEHKWSSATLYAGRGFECNSGLKGVQWIPCHRVWASRGCEVLGVIVGRVDHEVKV
jgi:diphthine-ammonia ligase